jgi:hypothetical protein
MGHARVLGIGVMLTWAVAGCGPVPGGPPGERGVAGATRAGPVPAPPALPPPDVIAWTAGGELVIADGATGAVKSAVAAPGASSDRDVAYDPWQERALIFQTDEDGESGEIASHAVSGGPGAPALGARVHEAWIDGRARVLPSPLGAVVFEASYGERWKLLVPGGPPAASVLAPVPASAWITVASSVEVHGLEAAGDPPALVRHTAEIQVGSLAAPSVEALPIGPATLPPTARLVPAPARGDAILVDVAGASLAVRLVDGAAVGPAAFAPLGAADLRIEGALAIGGGEVLALLLSGTSAVAAIEVDPAGLITSVALLALPGEVQAEPWSFSRDLAAQGPDRLLAATSAGVFAVRLLRDASGLHLQIEGGFDGSALRGPLATIDAAP